MIFKGFSLIEVLIALALSSLLMLSVTTMVRSVITSTGAIERMTAGIPLNRAKDIIARDFSSLFIAHIQEQQEEMPEESQDTQKTPSKTASPRVKQKSIPPFTLETHDTMTKCTFLATHTLSWQDQQKPRCARITYEIQKQSVEGSQDVTVRVTRIEQPFMARDKITPQRMIIFDGIQNFSITCFVRQKSDKESAIKEVKQWKNEAEEERNNNKSLTPDAIRVQLKRSADAPQDDWLFEVPTLHISPISSFIQGLLPASSHNNSTPTTQGSKQTNSPTSAGSVEKTVEKPPMSQNAPIAPEPAAPGVTV